MKLFVISFSMIFFVGIVPPPGISKIISNIQNAFGDNRLEPHITVRPPSALQEELKWINAIEQVANQVRPFTVHLTTTGYFGKGVLFIEVKSDSLQLLESQLTDALQPYEQKKPHHFHQHNFHAHLTIGRLWCGFTPAGFVQMEKLANDFLQQDVSFTIESLRIYCKGKSNEGYKVFKDVPLLNS